MTHTTDIDHKVFIDYFFIRDIKRWLTGGSIQAGELTESNGKSAPELPGRFWFLRR
jgi:hypothetical protein